jgi:ATP-dependent Clp protease ATP-binding subunit ClpB
MEGELQKLLHLEERARTSAWSARTRRSSAVANAVRRSRAGLQDPNRPDRLVPLPRPDRRGQDRARASALAEFLFDDETRDGPHRHVASTWRSTRSRG